MDLFTFMLGYVSGVVVTTAFIAVVTRRPKPVQLPPGFVPPSAALRPIPPVSPPLPRYPEHLHGSPEKMAEYDRRRPSTPANITAPKGSSK